MESIPLPENTNTMGSLANINVYLITVEKDDDGGIYIVSWFYGKQTVMFSIDKAGNVRTSDVDWS